MTAGYPGDGDDSQAQQNPSWLPLEGNQSERAAVQFDADGEDTGPRSVPVSDSGRHQAEGGGAQPSDTAHQTPRYDPPPSAGYPTAMPQPGTPLAGGQVIGGDPSGPYPVAGGPSGPYPVSGGPAVPNRMPQQGPPSGPMPAQGEPGTNGMPPGAMPQPGGNQRSPYQPPQGAQAGPPQRPGLGYPQQGVPQRGAVPRQHNPYATQGPAGKATPNDLGRQTQQAAHDLSSAQLLKLSKRAPESGWRKAVYVASGRTVNFGESPADTQRRELIGQINQPLRGCYKIAMLSLKGGVGKTTTTTTLGSTFSSLRGDRVIAVDANPDRGTLSQKIPLETTATVRHLLRDANRITRYSDVRSYTSQGPSRLEVLASEQDPAVSEAFSESDYRRTIDLLEHFYNIVLTDCGTGLMHSAMKGVLDIADSLVIVSSSSIDGARSASATLDWLDAHGYRDLVSRSVAVINSVRPRSGKVNLDRLTEHFAARCRAVCPVPFDAHLEEGAEIELDRLAMPTRTALLQLAATVADDFHADGARR